MNIDKVVIPMEVLEILERLKKGGLLALPAGRQAGRQGFEAFAVGGCVRDILLGKEPKDWDVTTNAKPEEIQKIFPKNFYENKFGTVGVITGSEKENLKVVEVTTYRIDGEYSDMRHPDEVQFAKTLEEDLSRRDFTVNAMALDVEFEASSPRMRGSKPKSNLDSRLRGNDIRDNGNDNSVLNFKLIDLFGGQEDLKNKTIRAVGEPEKRFKEDALRMMRAVRFASQLSENRTTWEIEEKTAKAIKDNSKLLKAISEERIRDEFLKLLNSASPDYGIETMRQLGLLKYVLPELDSAYGVGQNKHHIYDVYEHSLKSLAYAAKKNYGEDVRLAALLHDIGKPDTKHGEGPNSTFYNHEVVGAKIAKKILNRLKFSNKQIDKIYILVRYHLFYYNTDEVTESSVRRLVKNVGPENMEELIELRTCDRIGSGVPKAEPYKLRHLKYIIEKVSRDPISAKMVVVKGEDVMRILNIVPSPKIGQVLTILLDEVLDDPARNSKEYLENRITELGKLNDEELKKLCEKAEKKKEEVQMKIEDTTKKKYWVS